MPFTFVIGLLLRRNVVEHYWPTFYRFLAPGFPETREEYRQKAWFLETGVESHLESRLPGFHPAF